MAVEIHPVPVHEKHTVLHAVLALSILANLGLVGAIYSTFLNDFYFRLWVLANVYPILAVFIATVGVISLFANVVVWTLSLHKHLIRSAERRVANRLGVELH
jgi:hypothetical protein